MKFAWLFQSIKGDVMLHISWLKLSSNNNTPVTSENDRGFTENHIFHNLVKERLIFRDEAKIEGKNVL